MYDILEFNFEFYYSDLNILLFKSLDKSRYLCVSLVVDKLSLNDEI